MTINSSRKDVSQTLARVTSRRIELFLQHLANLTPMWQKGGRLGDAQQIIRLYPEFFPSSFPEDSALGRHAFQEVMKFPGWQGREGMQNEMAKFTGKVVSLYHVHYLTVALRKAWDQPDLRSKEWYIDTLRREFHEAMNPDSRGEPPPLSPFEQAMVYLKRISERAKHCGNPECENPYFVAKKRSYKYCSPECSEPAQKAFKRDWWAQHGPGWRKRQRENTKKRGR